MRAADRPQRLGISTYRRVASVLRRRISSGEWQPGDRLPALDALVEEFEVFPRRPHRVERVDAERMNDAAMVVGEPLDRIEPPALDSRNDEAPYPRGARTRDRLLAVVVELRSIEVDVGVDQHRSPSHCSTGMIPTPLSAP